jgi:hypothetical protein
MIAIVSAVSGTTIQCGAIVAVLLIVGFVFLRRDRKVFVFGILPLLILPLMHLIGIPISYYAEHRFHINFYHLRIYIDMIALVAACTLFGIFGRGLPEKRVRLGYIISSALFTIILGWVLVVDLLGHIK